MPEELINSLLNWLNGTQNYLKDNFVSKCFLSKLSKPKRQSLAETIKQKMIL